MHQKLEDLSDSYQRYTASNYLKANESKPVFMITRTGHVQHHVLSSLRVGNNYVYESPAMVFLGVTVNNTLSWMDHAKMLWAIYERRTVYYPAWQQRSIETICVQ